MCKMDPCECVVKEFKQGGATVDVRIFPSQRHILLDAHHCILAQLPCLPVLIGDIFKLCVDHRLVTRFGTSTGVAALRYAGRGVRC